MDKEEENTAGCLPMTEQVWQQILKYYLITYRGPDDEQNLRTQLNGYQVLTRIGRVNVGRFIRYMRKGIIDTELRRGGYVVKCTSKTIHVEDGRRRWRVSRADNYIFVTTDAEKAIQAPSRTRILAEQMLKADDEYRERTVTVRFQGE